MPSHQRPAFWPLALLISSILSSLISFAAAYTVPIVDTDYSRQTCSGMWGGPSAYINVTFDIASQGDLAMIIYEWTDVKYLGKETAGDPDDDLPQKTYVCTSSAVSAGYCTRAQLGRFILDLPVGKSINDTSFWSARVQLPANKTTSPKASNGFWDNPEGNPTPPISPYASPWRRDVDDVELVARWPKTPTAAIPVTVQGSTRRADTDVPYHPSYKGTVLFKNTFDGELPATDYPKVVYYLSGLVGLLVIEMFANWVYYRYLNAHGRSTASTVFLIVVAILDAGRNSMSFFMLLVVSLGLSVVRESLGRTMLKCQALAVAHFIFGILYAIGIVELELESTSALLLLMFIIPLAFTLSAFLLWIMYALNATITHLRARKQRYKLSMFQKLYYILLFTVFIIAIFFVVSSMSFSGRLAEDEIAQDEADAEDYDLEAIQNRGQMRDDDDDDDAATLVGGRRGNPNQVLTEDNVVFEIGDEEDDEEDSKKRKSTRLSGENHTGSGEEREGLMR
uniref:Uncharacterized protein n=1 Tax=Psilocybe cubensis TaxID=181762 RepID=A0A8H7Y739_PSICU